MLARLKALSTVALISGLALGCGPMGSQGKGGSGGGGAGSSGGGGNGGGGGSGGNGAIEGSVTASSFAAGTGTNAEAGYDVGAGFGRAGDCNVQELGPCEVSNCPASSPGSQAGTITLAGGATTVTLTPDATGAYPDAMGSAALWHGGESITIRAIGNPDGVSAFMGSLQAPAAVIGTMLGNVVWPAQPMTISRSAALTVAWNSSSAGVAIDIGPATGLHASCVFPPGSTSGTIPAEVMMMLPAGTVYLDLSAINHQMIMAGMVPVDLALLTAGNTASGDLASAELTLQ